MKEYIVSACEMKQYDHCTVENFKIPSMVLMERASLCVAEEAESYKKKHRIKKGRLKILIAAGSGNNGGDGIAAGRILLQRGYRVDFLICPDSGKYTQELRSQLQILGACGGRTVTVLPDTEYDIIVDALLGIGITRPVEGWYREVIEWINAGKSFVISADQPSGIHTDTGKVMGCAVRADVTVAFAYRKLGTVLYPGAKYAGRVVVKDIGIADKAFGTQTPRVFHYVGKASRALPVRSSDGHKGSFGKILIIAGSRDVYGAGILCAESAFRTGAGMVRVITEKGNKQSLQTMLPEALLTVYEDGKKDDAGGIEEALKWADCIVFGPGTGTGKRATDLLERILSNCGKPLIIDADGLTLISENRELFQLLKESAHKTNRSIILTPHIGEFSRMCGKTAAEIKENLIEEACGYINQLPCVLVCKDARTVCVSPNRSVYLNTSGNSGMATAGSGDVLAGIIGGLCAQRMAPFEAACAGVYLHGQAGDMAAVRTNEYSVIAGDIIKQLKFILK